MADRCQSEENLVRERRDEIADTVRQRIISGLHRGALVPGARLASTREIADEFGVVPRTAMSAYRVLEAEGFVELRNRSGIYVGKGSGGRGALLTQLAGWVVHILVDARAREIPPAAFPEHIRRCLETLRLRSVCVAGNADQLDHICRELHEDYGIESEGLEPEQISDPDADSQRAISRADLFVTTAVHSARVQQVARSLNRPAITVSLRQEVMGAMTRQLSRGPVYFIASDPRFRQALHAVFFATGHGGNARAVIVGEDDVTAIPPDAPTYIMRLAHERLGDSDLARRAAPLRRVFSNEMAHELLTFIVKSNMAAMSGRADR